MYPVLSRTRADFPKPSPTTVALVPNVGSLTDYCVAEATNPLYARDASATERQKMFAFVPRKLTLCRTKAHSVVKTVGLAVLVRGAGPIT